MAKVFDTPSGIISTPRLPNFDRRLGNLAGKTANFVVTSAGINAAKESLFRENLLQEDETDFNSKQFADIGSYSYIIFKGGNYKTLEGEVISYGGGTGSTLRIDAVLMNVTNSKNIITTALNGREGTIKEYYSAGDYMISISGVIVGEGNRYPADEVRLLDELARAPIAIGVMSPMLSRLSNVDSIVIDSISMNERAGFQNMQEFTISAMSDNVTNILE